MADETKDPMRAEIEGWRRAAKIRDAATPDDLFQAGRQRGYAEALRNCADAVEAALSAVSAPAPSLPLVMTAPIAASAHIEGRIRKLRALMARLSGSATGAPRRPNWQCSGCGWGFAGDWRKTCPACGREDYWTGSVHPEAKLWAAPGVSAGGEALPKYPPCPLGIICCLGSHESHARGECDAREGTGTPGAGGTGTGGERP